MKIDSKTLAAPLPRPARVALMATSALVAASGAMAQTGYSGNGTGAQLRLRNDYFGYGLSVGPRVAYSDNIDLANDGAKDGEVAAGVYTSASAIYTTKRFTGVMSGNLDLSYLVDQGKLVANQDAGAAGTATLVDNLFYFDLAGSTSRRLAGENARFSQNSNAARSQRVNVHDFSLSPYLNRRFVNGSAAELRYRFSQVFIGDGGNAFAQNFNSDSRSHEVIADFNSGSAFDRVQVGVNAFGAKTKESGNASVGDFEFRQGSIMSDVQFALSDQFALSGAVGYDDIETTSTNAFINDQTVSGVFWRAGFRARPGRRTDIRLEYGERFGNDFIDAAIRYNISNKLSFTANAGRSYSTRARAATNQYEALQRRTLDFVQALKEGEAGDAQGLISEMTRGLRGGFDAQTIGVGVSNDASASLGADFGRTTLSATARYFDTNYGFRATNGFGGELFATRQLSRRGTLFGGAFLRNIDTTIDTTLCTTSPGLYGIDTTVPAFDPVAACAQLTAQDGKSNTIGGRIGLSYRIYQNVSAYGELARTQRLSKNPLLEYDENTATVGLQVDF
jgi:uncharacterized protein (PEP-CTERM system associated)